MELEERPALAEVDLTRALLLELANAMVARGALQREDVAGALLRTEWAAEVLDNVAEEEGDLMRHHAGLAKATTEQWSDRLGLSPQIYALRKLHTEWLSGGQKGSSPLHAKDVIALFREDDE